MIHEFLGVSRTPSPWETPVVECATSNLKQFDDLMFRDPPTKDYISNSYESTRDKILNQLLLDFMEKNSNFMFDDDLSKMFEEADFMQKSSYAYGALTALKLNDKNSWDLIKSKFKPFVKCAVCKTKVNWKSNKTDEMTDINLDIENKTRSKIYYW